MNDLVKELGIIERFRINSASPFIFYENSGFAQQITSNGGGGIWLSTGYPQIESLIKGEQREKAIEYTSHNADTSTDRAGLLALFDLWVSYSDVLKKL